jgi:hypothetical protein
MSPEPGKGTHRYALLMFEQPNFQQIEPPTKRAYFQTKQVRCTSSSDAVSHDDTVASMNTVSRPGWGAARCLRVTWVGALGLTLAKARGVLHDSGDGTLSVTWYD